MAKVTKNFGIPPEALNEFTLEELQIMPRLLQKMEQVEEQNRLRGLALEGVLLRNREQTSIKQLWQYL
jgi:hypothetical protein